MFNKKVKPRRITRITDYMLGGATRITNLDGDEMLRPINMDRLWRYNVLKEKKRKERKKEEKKRPASLKTQKGGLGKS